MTTIPRPRRARPDYPKGVRRITDNGGRSADRYTVTFEPYDSGDRHLWQALLGMSENPFHPQGVGLSNAYPWGTIHRSWDEKIIAFADLPEDCRKATLQFLENDTELDTGCEADH